MAPNRLYLQQKRRLNNINLTPALILTLICKFGLFMALSICDMRTNAHKLIAFPLP